MVALALLMGLLACGNPSDAVVQQARQAAAAGDHAGAVALYDEAAALLPDDPAIYGNRANSYSSLGKLDLALADYAKAITLAEALVGPNDKRLALLYYNRGYAHHTAGQESQAIADMGKTLALEPDYPDAAGLLAQAELNFAWTLATSPDPAVRDPARALALATKVCPTHCDTSAQLDTLAAVYAANGDFEQAVHWQVKAVATDSPPGGEERLALYKSGKPFIGPTPSSP
jgi:tetratricopeptide (TPR) repeat protein